MIVVGADVSTKRLALADTTGKTASMLLDGSAQGRKAHDCEHRAAIFVRQFVNERPVLAVFCEMPAGRVVGHGLRVTVGAVVAGLYRGLRDEFERPVDVFPIAVAEWKKFSVGFGNASKDQVMQWALDHDFAPANQDEADSLGIAIGGAALISEVAA